MTVEQCSRIMQYLDQKFSPQDVSDYGLEFIPMSDQQKCRVTISNSDGSQYYSFLSHIDSENFNQILYKQTALSIAFLIQMQDNHEAYAGQKLHLGRYQNTEIEWTILQKSGSRLLLLSSSVLCEREFRHDWNTENAGSWEKSDIRKWLNTVFYEQAFSADEKILIADNHSDQVTLLSKTEAETLLTETERMADNWWWLRTAYSYGDSYIWYINHGGLLNGNLACKKGGIRPVIIIDSRQDSSGRNSLKLIKK